MQSLLDKICKVYYTKIAKRALQFKKRGGAAIKTRIPELRKERKLSQEELAQLQRSANTMREMIDKLDG